MTGGIVQRNYATNEIAIIDTKKMYCLQAWKQCTVVGGMCFHGELPCQKDMFPSGQMLLGDGARKELWRVVDVEQ
jgi:hypothetical protein